MPYVQLAARPPTARIEVDVYASWVSPLLGAVLIYKGLVSFRPMIAIPLD